MRFSSRSRRKSRKIFQIYGAVVAHHEGLAIKLGAAVDEGRDADKIEIAAQGVIVEDRPARDAGERVHRVRRRDGGGGRHAVAGGAGAGDGRGGER